MDKNETVVGRKMTQSLTIKLLGFERTFSLGVSIDQHLKDGTPVIKVH